MLGPSFDLGANSRPDILTASAWADNAGRDRPFDLEAAWRKIGRPFGDPRSDLRSGDAQPTSVSVDGDRPGPPRAAEAKRAPPGHEFARLAPPQTPLAATMIDLALGIPSAPLPPSSPGASAAKEEAVQAIAPVTEPSSTGSTARVLEDRPEMSGTPVARGASDRASGDTHAPLRAPLPSYSTEAKPAPAVTKSAASLHERQGQRSAKTLRKQAAAKKPAKPDVSKGETEGNESHFTELRGLTP